MAMPPDGSITDGRETRREGDPDVAATLRGAASCPPGEPGSSDLRAPRGQKEPEITTPTRESLQADVERDRLCDQFEAAMREGECPRIEDYLERVEPDRRGALLRELIALEMASPDYAIIPTDSTYWKRFPEWSEVVERAIREAEDEAGHAGQSASDLVVESDRFRILKHHADGGQGVVFVAFDESLKRKVALKQLQPDLANDTNARKRFEFEAMVTGHLEHPGVVPVHALGRWRKSGQPFFVTRLVNGPSLKNAIDELHAQPVWSRRARERRLTLNRLLRRFLVVCETMAYAHDQKVAHRDLKPQHILLGPFGETVIIDWGLAKPFGSLVSEPGFSQSPLSGVDRGDATDHGGAIGTLIYASPEQLGGDATHVGPATDVYSLGATLYEIITGRSAFDGTRPRGEIVPHTLAGAFPTPRQVQAHVPRGLDAICLKAMATRPEDRYPTVQALARDLEAWLDDEPVQAAPERRRQKIARWARRHTVLTAALATLLSVAATLGIGLGFMLQARHRRTLMTLERLDRVTIATVPEMTRQLAIDPDLAVGEIDALLANPLVPECQARLAALVRLGLKPGDTSRVRQDLGASEDWTAEVLDALLARPPMSLGQAADLDDLLAPVRDVILPELRGTLRGLRGRQPDAVLEQAGMLVLKNLADRPEELTRFVPDLPERALLQAIPHLALGPRDRIVASLREMYDRPLRGWSEQPPDPSWSRPDPRSVRVIEEASGCVDPHFIMVQALPFGKWPGLVEALRPAGYRPYRARPYRGPDGKTLLAGLWARDGLETTIIVDADEPSLRAAHSGNLRRELRLLDVAGSYTPEADSLRYLGVWSDHHGPLLASWRRKAEFPFQKGWENWPFTQVVADFDLGLTLDEARDRERTAWPRPDWVPSTVQLADLPDGSVRMTRSWELTPEMDTAIAQTFDPEAGYADRVFHGLYQRDVGLAFARSEGQAKPAARYAATWSPPTQIECRELHGLDLTQHLREARGLAANGFRPAAIAVATGPDGPTAASVWHCPADVSQNRAYSPERSLRIATTLYHLGDRDALWAICRRSPDPTIRYLIALHAPRLGLPARELIEHLKIETDPGIQQVLLLAIASYDDLALRTARIDALGSHLADLESCTPDPGVRSSSMHLRGRLEQAGLIAATREPRAVPASSGADRLWRTDSQGKTLAVVRGPVAFIMGESRYYPGEPDGFEARHRVRIDRSFAIQTTEVTVGDYRVFEAETGGPSPSSHQPRRFYPDQPEVPATELTLKEIARYANWRSEREGIPREQWCFIEDGSTLRLAPDYLRRVGYRPPTEAEWEHASRAGTTTCRPFGRTPDAPNPLIDRYAWHLTNATGRVHQVAQLWPNDLGLFDVLGNVRELCLNSRTSYCLGRCAEIEPDREEPGLAFGPSLIVTRGGSVEIPTTGLFSTHRQACKGLSVPSDVGLRLARTLPGP